MVGYYDLAGDWATIDDYRWTRCLKRVREWLGTKGICEEVAALMVEKNGEEKEEGGGIWLGMTNVSYPMPRKNSKPMELWIWTNMFAVGIK